MEKKTALVTGASEGIGRAFAHALAQQGYTLTLVARSEARLQELGKSLGEGHRVLFADLATAEGAARVAEVIKQGKFDLLINNAGAGVYGSFSEVELPKLQQMMRLNCDSLILLSHTFLAGAKSGDALINVASTLALLAFPGSALYAATKALVLSLSESLWFENRKRGVYVMGLCPGLTDTQFHTSSGGTDANRPPKNMSQTPEQVVAEALAALGKRAKPTVVTGFPNRAMLTFTKFMSRKGMIKMMGGFSPVKD